MKTYKCIIIDDEPMAVNWLTDYINELPTLQLVKSYTNPVEALTELTSGNTVDLILLDVNMPFISGIDLSLKIKSKTNKLVFTTAYRDFAYEAFEADADAFLLKPFSLSKFAATITKLFPKPVLRDQAAPVDDFFLAKNSNDALKMVKIRFADVIAIESKQNYVLIHTVSGNILTHMTLREVAAVLKSYPGFEQFQRSFIISKNYIEHIYGNTIKMINGLQITIGDMYRKEFTRFLDTKLLRSRN
ncbi:response regulator transcription factor [Mucilaginibacter achroorhodeus]|uniref:Response regulator transcription factor n=2 Tax=Mucilaginibacter achroorhodeus TaxID=2599294 RepID=A0A563U7G8_9SPHI|nr:response regulator transcription factor [Mucilaginibacter achroorhodeus]